MTVNNVKYMIPLLASCATQGDKYSRFITYDTIVTDLGITGITQ